MNSNNIINIEESVAVNIYKKGYYKEINRLMEKLYNNGVEFYSFTRVYPINKEIYVNYERDKEELKQMSWDGKDKEIKRTVGLLLMDIPFIEFAYISIEAHKGEGDLEGYPHLHGIFGVNTIVGGIGESLLIKIKESLTLAEGLGGDTQDTRVNYLKSLKDVIQSINYVIKDFELHRHYFYKFNINSKYKEYYELFDSFREFRAPVLKENDKYELKENKYQVRDNKLKIEIINREREFDEIGILNLINIYMQLENLYYNKGGLYRRIKGSKSSYVFIERIEKLLNNFKKVLSRLIRETEIFYQFEFGNIYSKVIKILNTGKQIMIKDPELSLVTIEINIKVCEFKDGYYFMEEDLFINYENYKELINRLIEIGKINSTKYYNKTYHHLGSPKFWLSCIKSNLVDDEKEFLRFCQDFGMLLHEKSVGSKKKDNVYIEGETNTGKSSLVSKVLLSIYGEENIGIVGISDRFHLEQAVEKMILLCDEFVYRKKQRSDLLKIMDNSPMLVDKKHKTSEIIRSTARALFMANPHINEEFILDKAIESRLSFYRFRNARLLNDPMFLKKIEREIPKILVYCNREYMKTIQTKKPRITGYLEQLLIEGKKEEKEISLINFEPTQIN